VVGEAGRLAPEPAPQRRQQVRAPAQPAVHGQVDVVQVEPLVPRQRRALVGRRVLVGQRALVGQRVPVGRLEPPARLRVGQDVLQAAAGRRWPDGALRLLAVAPAAEGNIASG
jgi:hypothetical protein